LTGQKICTNPTDFILSAIPYLKKFVFAVHFVYNQKKCFENHGFIA